MTRQTSSAARRRAGRFALVAVLVAALFGAPALISSLRPTQAPQGTPALVARAPDPVASGEEPTPPAAESDDPIAGAPPGLTAPITFDREAELRAGRIIIPAIGLDTTFANGVYDEVLQSGPGLWPGTPLPGSAGNSVLSGHRTTWTKPFGDLDRLVAGDVITAAVGPQPGTDYRVVATRIVPEAEYVDVVLAQPPDPAARTITLFACHPKGSRTHRIVVTAAADPLPSGS